MAAKFRTVSLYLLLIALSGVSLFGCGDGAVNTNVDQSRADEDGTAPQLGDDYFMVPAGATDLIGNVTETVELKVFLYKKTTGEPAFNQNIAFEIIEPVDQTDTTLSAFNSATSEDGGASVDLRLGAQPQTLKVKADHGSSNGVTFTVDIRPLETGDLEITMVNTGASVMQLADIDLRLYRDGDYSCSEFRPLSPREEGDLSTYVAGTISERVKFEELGTRERFMVTAVGRGDRGQIAGAGCIEDIEIRPDEITRKELLLQLIPLNPVGRYDVTSHWDFSQALEDSGAVGSTIMRILDFFENPGQTLYDEVMNLLQQFLGLGGTAMDQFLSLTGLEDDFVNMVNNWINNNDALAPLMRAGQDLRNVVANLEVHSELTIGKMSSNYEFRGTDNWLGITLYWRWDCDANSPPDCGAINIQADADGDFGDLGIMSSEWTGRVAAYNQLQIDMHPLSLRYGRLIMYILNDVIIPELTDGNASSLSEAFSYWICDGLGTSITGSDGEMCVDLAVWDGCIYDHQISGFCQNASSTVFSLADMLVRNLEYDLGMRIGGEGVLVETTSDGFVDFIEEGKFDGFMQNADLNQSQASPISADFEAERIDFDTDNL
ncbi:hypothetical protein FIV42_29385 [Persicimonas caeni]|uniref:Abnormal spindle-like microcephaly-associated protein ASH domain-containing protein n=1 Tax=Persicimonas caeni TaxID=2292766 RepID=A0A4Y6Q2K8_PERCE|nr:hypothetical protein [Persicimonas caeni]QDG54709.1 hypothetical protein FIV42_29385 [Persicimonas caeni]QED35930.1 hypothetical protein FRD00_29380 [Persicimonas caeni]